VACHAQNPEISQSEPEKEFIESFDTPHTNTPYNNTWEHSELCYDQANSNVDIKIKGFLRKDNVHSYSSFLSLLSFIEMP
jgi:hypothetical protein